MLLARKKLISYILLLILGIMPLMSTAAMVQFELNENDVQSMQKNASVLGCQDCTPEAMADRCDSNMSSCGTCVSCLYDSSSSAVQPFNLIFTSTFHTIHLSFISTPDSKPPRT
jgi:hypothetical protein